MKTEEAAASSDKNGAEMSLADTPPRQLEGRSDQRTNVFVSAALYYDDNACPAKVRNLSEFGALIEASVLPPPGTRIRLCRGNLAVSGKVVWQRVGKAGLRFDSAITIVDWLPNRACRHQSRVDDMVHHFKMGSAAGEVSAPKALHSSPPGLHQLATITLSIEQIGDALAGDPHIISNHSWTLQQLDLAAQQLRHILSTQPSKSG